MRSSAIKVLGGRPNNAKLLPRKPYNCTFPSWSWASVGGSAVTIRPYTDYRALSVVNDVRVALVDPAHPFGSIHSGTITITGHLKRFSRLYNPNWKSAGHSITPLESNLSSLIAKGNPEDVEAKYSPARGQHFAALQMLRTMGFVELLILESLGHIINGIGAYCRVGLHTVPIGHVDPESANLFKILKEFDTSLQARLRPPRKTTEWDTASKELREELRNESWDRVTVVLV